MPIPSSINDLDVNPNNNSPQGSEPVGPHANGYLQALGAFIRQIANGAGFKPTSPVDANGQRLTNLAPGDVSTNSKDAVTGAQLRAVYKKGEVKMWHGAAANIASVWGAGWQLADGSNGTADLQDKFVVGAGRTYSSNATGGMASNTLTVDQLPSHGHGVSDSGHEHGINDGGHGHGVNDPGHHHDNHVGNIAGGNAGPGGAFSFENPGGKDWSTSPSGTGISIANSRANISLARSQSGISIQSTGSGASVENRPPYYALCFIEFVGP